ncbi:acetyltransferase [Xylanibacillus composti]|uniref:Acetyltransferase n=1 Tax=Xylanibacillus composti TaxID=1572762 RepID=A0A8J4M3K7_9BACL|nr:GNAT family N-acetyltransferase [Xylanibacillus composti]GIQ69606.1 acetyltransferase [Xylanibacillus composti]
MVQLIRAEAAHAEAIVPLYQALMQEIADRSGQAPLTGSANPTEACRQSIEQGKYTAFLAQEGDGDAVGFLSLCESFSLYAGGSFGIIQELYVKPAFRSKGIGQLLLQAAYRHAKEQNWSRLEVNTPPLPAFTTTFSFYANKGFTVSGGRKLKWTVA